MRRRTGLHILLALSLCAMVYFVSKSTTTRVRQVLAQTNLVPFEVERWVYSNRHDPAGALVMKEITAANSEGSLVSVASTPLDPGQFVTRKIQRVDGTEIHVVDPLKLVSTFHTGDARLLQKRALYAQAGCLVQGRPEAVLGRAQILGYDTVIVQTNSPKTVRITNWRAPAFGCLPLRVVNERFENGAFVQVSEYRPVRVQAGEPPRRLFEVAADYAETKPSDAAKKLGAYFGREYPAEALQSLQEVDQDYEASRAKPK